VYHVLDEADYARLPEPWVDPPAAGPPAGRRPRAGGVQPPPPLPTAAHPAADVAAAAMAAVPVLKLGPMALVEGASAAMRQRRRQWRRPRWWRKP